MAEGTQAPDPGEDVRVDAVPPDRLVPAWLAALVLVLLLGIAAVGGFLVRGLLIADAPSAPAEMAIEDLTEQAEQDPDDPEALLGLAYAQQQDGDLGGALSGYERVLELDPGNPGALYNKGTALLALGRGKEAEATFWDVLEAVPDHVNAAQALGEYYIGQKHYKSALTALEPVAKARPEFAELQYLSGYACEQLAIRDIAISYYRAALAVAPDHAGAREGLARLSVAL
ncbi:MAG: tetratricopeptide repeat protein [Coriobacteriia bacterium]|nr:tetratricopeptide repeat protein [Coriobacteriia bacterium]